jgi:hypothetical protein
VTTPINNIPAGLLSLLGSKGAGGYPHDLADAVVSTINVFDLYAAINREALTSAVVAAAVGSIFYPDLNVPGGQIWYVEEYQVCCNVGAGAAIDFAPAYVYNAVGPNSVVGVYQAGAATQNVRAPMNRPRFWGPGTNPGAHVRSQTLAPNTFATILFTRLLI